MGIIHIQKNNQQLDTMKLLDKIIRRGGANEKDVLVVQLIDHIHGLEGMINEISGLTKELDQNVDINTCLQWGINVGYLRYSRHKVRKAAEFLFGDRNIEHYMLAVWIGYNSSINNIHNINGEVEVHFPTK